VGRAVGSGSPGQRRGLAGRDQALHRRTGRRTDGGDRNYQRVEPVRCRAALPAAHRRL